MTIILPPIRKGSPFQQSLGLLKIQSNPPFIDNTFIFFLNFQKEQRFRTGRGPIAAQAQLLFIRGLFQRAVNQAVVRCIKIDVADGVLSVLVRVEIGGEGLAYFLILFPRQKEFLLYALEGLFRHVIISLRSILQDVCVCFVLTEKKYHETCLPCIRRLI